MQNFKLGWKSLFISKIYITCLHAWKYFAQNAGSDSTLSILTLFLIFWSSFSWLFDQVFSWSKECRQTSAAGSHPWMWDLFPCLKWYQKRGTSELERNLRVVGDFVESVIYTCSLFVIGATILASSMHIWWVILGSYFMHQFYECSFWCSHFQIMDRLKVWWNQKANWRALDSPKKQTDEFDLFAVKSKKANKTNSSVRFLGEVSRP